jgi:thiol reductant ABC exporter CydC subunit
VSRPPHGRPPHGRPPRGRRAIVRRLLRVGRPPWGRLGLSTLLGALGAAATVGLLAGSGAVVAKAAFRPGLGAIAGLLAAVEVIAFLRGPLRYGERLVGHDAAFRVLGRWRLWLYGRLEPLAPAGLQAWRSGDLLARAVDDVDELQDLYLRIGPPAVIALTTSVLAVVVVGVLVPYAALVVGLSLLGAMIVPAALAVAVRSAAGRQSELRGEMAADVVDLLRGSADLLAFGRTGEVLERVREADRSLTRGAKRRALATALVGALVTVFLGVAVVGVLILSANAVHEHRLEPVMMAVLPLATIGAFEAVPPVSAAVLRFGEVVAAGGRILAIGDVPAPVSDPVDPARSPAPSSEIALRDARLRYAEHLRWVLEGVDVELGPGSRTAVVGRSGAGKTSLVHALLRYWPLGGGSYTVGGTDATRLRQDDVRSRYALLDQDADLFAGSIRDNVALADPEASDARVRRVVELAQLSEWVDALPEGLDTPVGEHGTKVSGGQRQRIAMARAMLRSAPILLLDEPTAGLDPETAERLLGDLRSSFPAEAILLVTHRPEELVGFDRVLTMREGRLVEGTPPAAPAPGHTEREPGGS